MSDLISRSALYEKMTEEYKKHYAGTGTGYDFTIAMNMVQQQPTIEAVPVVHGRIIYKIDVPHCSVCGKVIHGASNYCRHCGARLDLQNAEHIKAMTDEELATELIPIFEEICEDGVPSPEWMRMWLQSEVEEEQ